MISSCLVRVAARVVLVSYVTQMIAPVVYATESSVEFKGNWRPLHMPTIKAPEEAKQIIDDYEQGQKGTVLSQSQAYQYHLGIKANAKKDKYQIKFSRKEKGSTGEFEALYTQSIRQGKIDFQHPLNEADNDVLLTLFKGASAYKLEESGLSVHIPGFGKVMMASDGTVIVDKDHATSLLSTYDLILQASGELHINAMAVAALTLESQKTKLFGPLNTNTLHMNHDVVNLLGLSTHSLTGTGNLSNQGILNLEGTSENPAILGIHNVINENNTNNDITAEIKSEYLHIPSTNTGFMNGEDALFTVTKKLIVDDAASGNLLNAGKLIVREGEINRYFINDGRGELSVCDQLLLTNFLNEGDVEVENLMTLIHCHNKGTIQGQTVDVKESMTNDGQVSLNQLLGKGIFINHRALEFRGKDACLTIAEFQNDSIGKSKAHVDGTSLKVGQINKEFINQINSSVNITDLYIEKSLNAHSQPVQNFGTIKSKSIETNRPIKNKGKVETATLNLGGISKNSQTFEESLSEEVRNYINILGIYNTISMLRNQGQSNLADQLTVHKDLFPIS